MPDRLIRLPRVATMILGAGIGLVLLLGVTGMLAWSTLTACEIEDAADDLIHATVRVDGESGAIGTAFHLGQGRFITAAHVVEGVDPDSFLGVRRLDSVAIRVRVAWIDDALDLAVLESTTCIRGDCRWAAVLEWGYGSLGEVRWGDSGALRIGQLLGVTGYPAGSPERISYVINGISIKERGPASFVAGRVSKIVDLGGRGTLIQTDAALNPGNSGGPMFDSCGRVVGVVQQKIVDVRVEGIGLALAEESVPIRLR